MYKITLPKKMPSDYFWYIFRCFNSLKHNSEIQIEYFDSPIKEKYVMLFYFNDKPVFIDVRDDNRLSETYRNWDAIVLKSNYSSELWDNTPKEFEQPFYDWEREIRHRIRPFIHGRAFPFSLNTNEIPNKFQDIKYDVVSLTGNGIYNENTAKRLDFYELIQNEPSLKKNLVFWIRKHGNPSQPMIPELLERAKKFNNNISYAMNDYTAFLSEGKYSLNIPGITLSQSFRCVDAVLANRCIISTKIWQDIWKSFPCVELPICAYFGTGDYEKAKEILNKLSNINYTEMLNKSKDWYSWYLSADGMFKNQFLKQLENNENIN